MQATELTYKGQRIERDEPGRYTVLVLLPQGAVLQPAAYSWREHIEPQVDSNEGCDDAGH